MGFINLGRLNIRQRNFCASALVSLSDVQPPSVYKSHILKGPVNKVYLLLVDHLQSLSMPRNSMVRLTDWTNMTIAVYLDKQTNLCHGLFQRHKLLSSFLSISMTNC